MFPILPLLFRFFSVKTSHKSFQQECTEVREGVYAMQGEAGCSGLQIREDVLQQAAADALGLDAYDEDTFRERIASVVSDADHVLTFRFRYGHTAEIKWETPSRARSWTPEMRQAAAERTRQQRRKP